jgi:hypothetical protein
MAATEVKRIAACVQHNFHHVRVEQVDLTLHRMARRGHRGFGVPAECFRYFTDQPGRDTRLVALDVDHDGVIGPAALGCDLGDAVRARCVAGGRHQALMTMLADRPQDALVIGRDPYFGRAARLRPIRDTHYHGLAGDVEQRLAGQARRGVAGGDDDDERHRATGDGRQALDTAWPLWFL